MNKSRGIITTICVSAGIVFLLLPFLEKSSNCGGNSAALSYTNNVSLCVIIALKERSKESGAIHFSELIPPESWNKVFRFGWGVKSYWVRRSIDSSDRAPVIICAQCFDNVPEPKPWNFYKRTPRFAAGFLHEPSRLLEMREYNALNFHEYRYIREIDVLQKKDI